MDRRMCKGSRRRSQVIAFSIHWLSAVICNSSDTKLVRYKGLVPVSNTWQYLGIEVLRDDFPWLAIVGCGGGQKLAKVAGLDLGEYVVSSNVFVIIDDYLRQ